MTEQEAVESFKNQYPVTYDNGIAKVDYSKISALIYRYNLGALEMTVELLDKNKNCVAVARPKEVHIRR